MLYNFFIHIWLILNFITMLFCLYHLSLSLSAFRRDRQEEKGKDVKYHRFAAVIAARNEENVITSLIDSIHMQNYPQGLIDVIVVADNCTDDTAGVAEKAGAIVFKRYNKVQVGKGYVVKFAIDKIFEERDEYDALCIIDADNVVDRNFFLEMNHALCSGAQVAQGYRDMKNPTDNWISGCHSLFYWMENRFFDAARAFLGLSASINGTGFMMSREYLRKFGFKMKTVTEDLELTMQCVINGERVVWVPQARVYDEQPLSVRQSVRQRTRWTNGFIQCFAKYAKPFFSSIIHKPTWIKIDMFMFVLSLPVMIAGAAATILYLVFGVVHIFDPMSTIVSSISLVGGSAVIFWVIGFLSVMLEKKPLKGMWKAILTYPLFNLMWVFIYCICIFKRTNDWKPIIHARNISIQEIEATQQK